jgi:hypothetical protein
MNTEECCQVFKRSPTWRKRKEKHGLEETLRNLAVSYRLGYFSERLTLGYGRFR